MRVLAAAIAIVGLVSQPLVAQERLPREGLRFFDTGPLRIREQFLLGQGFLAFEPVSGDLLDRGEWQIDLVQNATNTWAYSDPVRRMLGERATHGERPNVTLDDLQSLEAPEGRGLYFADGELHRGSLSVRRGVGRGLQLSLTVPMLNFNGGLFDSNIEEFHSTIGNSQSGRDGAPRRHYRVYLREPSGREVYREVEPSAGLGDVTVGAKIRLPTPSPAWDFAAEGRIKLPTGEAEDLYGSGALDVGVQWLITRWFSRSCVHAAAGVTYVGEHDVFAVGDDLLWSAMLAYEHALGRTASVILQGTASQSPFEELDIQRLDDVSYLVDLGFKKRVRGQWVAFLAISENILTFGSSADVGLHLGVTWTR